MGSRKTDPRVVRTRAAVMSAARVLFLARGYAGTTMDDIAEHAGITKRTLYNNYADKEQLFMEIVSDATTFAETFARDLPTMLGAASRAVDLRAGLQEFALRLARAIVRDEVISLRRLLVGEARTFPSLGRHYFKRAPAQVITSLASEFARLRDIGLLVMEDERRAAMQFAYLVVGAPLDQAMLTGKIPPDEEVRSCALEGVATFLARYENTTKAKPERR